MAETLSDLYDEYEGLRERANRLRRQFNELSGPERDGIEGTSILREIGNVQEEMFQLQSQMRSHLPQLTSRVR